MSVVTVRRAQAQARYHLIQTRLPADQINSHADNLVSH